MGSITRAIITRNSCTTFDNLLHLKARVTIKEVERVHRPGTRFYCMNFPDGHGDEMPDINVL